MRVLALDHVTKRFGAVHALRDVSFTIERGEVFGYLGPNGAGKTTTLRTVLGLVRPDSGHVTVLDRAASDPAARERVGFLPGELRLWNELSGRAILDHFARYRPHQPPALRQRLLDALDLDGATLARRVKVLSHGTRQKLGLVIAMQHDPALVLLDEPSLGLDPLVQRAFRDVVRDIAARGSAVLFSSHVLSEVESVCSRVAIIRSGELVAIESVSALRRRLVRRMTVTFRDAPPGTLRDIPGIEHIDVADRVVTFSVRGDVNPLLRLLAGSDVEEMIFPEPQLEDAFLGYYDGVAP
jgi:ABC-2 type transport system ATP-binding protein